MTTLFVPEGTGPYNVDGAEYPVVGGKIECNNRDHIAPLKSLGASETPIVPVFSEAAPVGERIASDFGPTQAEHDSLRAKHDALVEEGEKQIAEIETYKGQIATLADAIIELNFDVADESAVECAIRHLRAYRDLLDTAPEDAPGTDAGADTADTGADASGGTSSGDDEGDTLADPGFTEDSDYQEILAWLKTNEVEHPGNISKVNALALVAETVAKSKG